MKQLTDEESKQLLILYKNYLNEKENIDTINRHILMCKRDLDIKPKIDSKEVDLRGNISKVKSLPSKRKYDVVGNLDEKNNIENLQIENKIINTSVLDEKYKKMFFKKPKSYLYQSLFYSSTGLIILFVGVDLKMPIFILLSMPSLGLASLNMTNYILDNRLKPFTHIKMKNKDVLNFRRKLTEDLYKARSLNYENDINNRDFINHKLNLLYENKAKHQNKLNEYNEEMMTILDENSIMEKDVQKVLKRVI